jgi:large subunit ribosomal protein L33
MRDIIQLQCGTCKRRNYTTTKNKKKQQGKLEVKKYCPFCRSHQVHKEVK